MRKSYLVRSGRKKEKKTELLKKRKGAAAMPALAVTVTALFLALSLVSTNFDINLNLSPTGLATDGTAYINTIQITADATQEFIEQTISFAEGRPQQCADGIYVTDGNNAVPFEIISEKKDNRCSEATIRFANSVYGEYEEVAQITGTNAITGLVVDSTDDEGSDEAATDDGEGVAEDVGYVPEEGKTADENIETVEEELDTPVMAPEQEASAVAGINEEVQEEISDETEDENEPDTLPLTPQEETAAILPIEEPQEETVPPANDTNQTNETSPPTNETNQTAPPDQNVTSSPTNETAEPPTNDTNTTLPPSNDTDQTNNTTTQPPSNQTLPPTNETNQTTPPEENTTLPPTNDTNQTNETTEEPELIPKTITYFIHYGIENHAPVSSKIPEITLTTGDRTTLNLDDYFSDQDGDILTFTFQTSEEIATTTISETMLSILALAPGQDTLTITASDGELEAVTTTTLTITTQEIINETNLTTNTTQPPQNETNQTNVSALDTIDILRENSAPTAKDISLKMKKNSKKKINLKKYFSDEDKDELTYIATIPNTTTKIRKDSLKIELEKDFVGTISGQIIASDGADTATASVIITVKDRKKIKNPKTKIDLKNKTGKKNVTHDEYEWDDDGTTRTDLEFDTDEDGLADIQIFGATNVPAEVNSYYDVTDYEKIKTEVFAFDSITIESAEITLKKNADFRAIARCDDFDFTNGKCNSRWTQTDIDFADNGTHVTFTVTEFSAYGGASLDILNVESNPRINDNWTVNFITNGTANLYVTPINGTEWDVDLEFKNLTCGESLITTSLLANDSRVAYNYSCNETSHFTDIVLTSGHHFLQFDFGDSTATARNFACDSGSLSTECNVTTTQALTNGDVITGSGRLSIRPGGKLTTSATQTANLTFTSGNVTIYTGGNITGNVNITAANVTIETGAKIDSDSLGHAGGDGPGAGGSDADFTKGGGYGGAGGRGTTGTNGGSTYGSKIAPAALGSGGGDSTTYGTEGGKGGGMVIINASGTVNISGSILARGGAGNTGCNSRATGGGSGGSIWINATTIVGSGSLYAGGGNGGVCNWDGGGGGGGRVAITAVTNDFEGSTSVSGGIADDSSTAEDGASGTVYDGDAPVVTITNPANTTLGSTNVTLNFTATDTIGVSSCWYFNTTGSNVSLTSCNNITFTGTNNAWQNITVYASDTGGNTGSTQRFFTVDNTAPTITITNPTNVTNSTTNITLNFTASDSVAGVDSCWYFNSTGQNVSLPSCANITFAEGDDGYKNITIYANDTLGNTNSSQVFWTTDTTNPSVSISAPTNTTTSNTSVELIFTASDTNPILCTRELDGTNTSIASCDNQTMTSLSESTHTVKIFANDTANNTAVDSISFTVDALPQITITNPTNTTNATTNISLNFTATDSSLDSCWYFNTTGQNISLPSCSNITFLVGDGYNNITVYANDTSGQTNSSQRFWTTDAGAPAVSIVAPSNDTVGNTTVELIFTASDDLLDTCVQEVDGKNTTLVSCANGTIGGNGSSSSAADTTDENFGNGTLTNATVNDTGAGTGGNVTLIPNATNNYANMTGEFTSRIFDSSAVSNWTNITWSTEVPYEKEIGRVSGDTNDAADPYVNTSGLVLLYHFNNESAFGEGGSLVYDYSTDVNSERSSAAENNGTMVNGTVLTTSAKMGAGAVSFDGVDDYVNVDGVADDFIESFTISAWIKEDSSGDKVIVGRNDNTGSNKFVFNVFGGSLAFYNGTITILTDGNLTGDGWHHAAVTYNSSSDGVLLYVDGTQANSSSGVSSLATNDKISIGQEWDNENPSGFFNGTIDEVSIWNRSLSATEILNLYKRGALRLNLTVRSCDDASCSGESWSEPLNDSSITVLNSSIADNRYFQYRAELNTTDANYTPILNDFTANYTLLRLSTGAHTVKIFANDTVNNTNVTSQTFTVDETAPSITITNPTNTTNASLTYNLNFTVSDSFTDSCWYINSTGGNNSLASCANTTFTEGADGYKNITVYANDTVGNTGSSQRFWTTDTTGPTVTITNPTNTTNTSTSILLNFTATDTNGVDSCWYINTTGQNNSLASCANTSFTVSDGYNNITVYANDTYGNTNSSQRFWTTDAGAPAVSIVAPSNDTVGNTTVELIFTASDDLLDTCVQELNGKNNITLTSCANTTLPNTTAGFNEADTTDENFGNGTLTNASVNDTGAPANVTLNFTTVELGRFGNDAVDAVYPSFNTSGLVLLYHFNNESAFGEGGAVVYDYSTDVNSERSSAAENNGTLINGTILNTSSKLGSGAASFDGVDDYVDVGDTTDLDGATELSVAAWIYTDGNTDPNQASIVTKYNTDSSNRVFSFDVGQPGSNELRFILYGSDGNGDWDRQIGENITLSEWNFVTVVWDSSHNINLYVDGEEIQSTYATGGTAPTQVYDKTSKLYIGAADKGSTAPDYFFNGTIDEVAIFNRSLSAAEIRDLYNRGQKYGVRSAAFTSRIFDSGATANWTNITWSTEVPYQKEIGRVSGDTNDAADPYINTSGLVLLYYLNNESGYGEGGSLVYDYSTDVNSERSSAAENNGTLINGTVFTTSSKLGSGAGSFDGVDDYISVSHDDSIDFVANEDFTIGGWFKTATSGSIQRLITKRVHPDAGYNIYIESDKLRFGLEDTVGSLDTFPVSTSTVTDDSWHHFAAVRDYGNNVYLYIDGRLEDSNPDTIGSLTTANPLIIGAYDSSPDSYYFNGTIDEVAIWNRSLSATEILNLYKRGALKLNLSVRSCDDAACSGESWSEPLNDSSITVLNSSIADNRYFQYRAELNTTDANYTPILNDFTANYTLLRLSTGAHTVKIFANDTVNNTNVSSVSFTVDETAPTVSVDAPTNTTIGNEDVNISFTASDTFLDSCWYIHNTTNNSLANCANTTIASMDAGVHNITVFANDTVGQTTASSTIFFTVTDSVPRVSLVAPSNDTVDNLTVEVIFTAADLGLDTCVQEIDGANYTLTSCANGTITNTADVTNSSAADTTDENFGNGTLTNTTVNDTGAGNGGNVTLIPNATNKYQNMSGVFTSRIFDASAVSNWTNITWSTEVPYQAEIGRVSGDTNDATDPYINTSGLVALYHFNNESAFGEGGNLVYDYSTDVNSERSSAAENNGTLINGTVFTTTDKKFGDGAASFDGTNDVVDANNIGTIKSAAYWINPGDSSKNFTISFNSSAYFSEYGLRSKNLFFNYLTPYVNGHLVLGSELLTNRDFDSDISSWEVLDGTVSWSSDEGAIDMLRGTDNKAVKQNVNLTAGWYMLSGRAKKIENVGNLNLELYNTALTTRYTDPTYWTEQTAYTKLTGYAYVPSDAEYSFVLYLVNDPNAHYRLEEVSLKKLTPVTVGSWSHVALVFGDDVVANDLLVGSANNKYFNGSIDEVAIWNRSLSATEILNLYKRGALKLNLTVRSCNDDACDTETWSEPLNDSAVTILNSSIADNRYFQYRAELNTTDANYTPILNDFTVYYQNYSTTLTKGAHTLKIFANDTSGGSNVSTVGFTVDESSPAVSITSPSNATTGSTNVTLSFTATDDFIDTCVFQNNTVNYTLSGCGNITFTVSGDSQTVKVFANDTLNNTNVASVSFMVDTAAPSVSVVNPTNTTNATSTILLNYTVSDNNTVDSCWYVNTTGQNNSLASCANATFTEGVDGYKNITVYVNDTAGWTNSSQVFWTVDSTGPTVTITNPANVTNATGTMLLNFTVTDALNSVDQCWYINATGQNNSLASCTNTSFSVSDGYQNITVYANDSLGNTGSSQRFWISDTVAPSVSVVNPTNTTNSSTNITLNFTVSDATTYAQACWYINTTGQNVSLSSCSNITFAEAGEGYKNITVYGNDSAGNTGSSQRFWTLDNTVPVISILAPSNDTVGNTSVELIFRATDINHDSCVRELDGTNTTITSCNNQTMSGLSTGAHTVKVFANDTANNTNVASQTFTVDETAPTVSITSPVNGTVGSTNVTLNFTASDDFLDSCVLQNNTVNYTLSGCGNITFTVEGDAQTVKIFANDTVNNTAVSSVNFVVDEAAPSVSITNPTNTTNSTATILLNYTVSDNNTVDSCWYVNTTGGNNSLGSCTNTTFTVGDGYHNITVYVNDSAGNTNSSQRFWLRDTTGPTITIDVPGNITYGIATVNLNYTSIDALHPVSHCVRELNGTNTTMDSCANASLTLGNGTFTLKVFSNDTLNNTNVSSVNFEIDLDPPTVNLVSPANVSYNTKNTTLEYTATDRLAVDTCKYDLDGTTTTIASCANITFLAAEGVNMLNLSVNDTAGNFTNVTVNFTVDTIPPQVTQSLSNSFLDINYGNLNVTVNISDANIDSLVTTVTRPDGSRATYNFTANGSFIFNTTTVGVYNVSTYGNDTVNNTNTTAVSQFTAVGSTVAAVVGYPVSFNATKVTASQGENITINANFSNTGNGIAYFTNITITAPENWTITNISTTCNAANVSRSTNCSRVVNVTVPAGTTSGQSFTVTSNATYMNANNSIISIKAISTINISTSAVLIIQSPSLSNSSDHNVTNQNFGTFTINSSGAENAATITYDITGDGINSSWFSFSPSSISTLAVGSTADVTVLVSVPYGSQGKLYTGTLNVYESSSLQDTEPVNLTINEDKSWTSSPQTFANQTIATQSTGSIGTINITNDGNVDMNFTLTKTGSAAAIEDAVTLSPSSLTVTRQNSSTVSVNYNTAGVVGGSYNITIVINETSESNTNSTTANITVTDTPPQINSFTANETLEINEIIMIIANVSDNIDTPTVRLNITLPNATLVQINTTKRAGNTLYDANYTATQNGTYQLLLFSNDSQPEYNNSQINVTVFGSTTVSISSNVSSITISGVSQSTGATIPVNLTINNTGPTRAISTNVSLTLPENWTNTSATVGTMANFTATNKLMNITVPAGAAAAGYTVTFNITWGNPNGTNTQNTTSMTVTLSENAEMSIAETSVALNVNHSSTNSTTFTLNSTGNNASTGLNITCLSGVVCDNFTVVFDNISSVAAGETQSVSVNVTVPAGYAPATYTGSVNVTSTGGNDTVTINVTVPTDTNWTASPSSFTKITGLSADGDMGSINVTNLGNVAVFLNITTGGNATSLVTVNETNVTIAKQNSILVALNYSSGATPGMYTMNVSFANLTITPNVTNISVTINVTNFTAGILSPSQSSPVTNITAGDNVSIVGNATLDGSAVSGNITWTAKFNSTACPVASQSYNSTNETWTVTCTAPSITDALYYALNLTANYSVTGVIITDQELQAVHYKDVSAPVFAGVTNKTTTLPNTTMNITANITDNSAVSTVIVQVTPFNSTATNFTMTNITNETYNYSYSNTTVTGDYSVRIFANDSLGNNGTADGFFTVAVPVELNITVKDASDNPVNATLRLFRPNTTTELFNSTVNTSSGTANRTVDTREYDVRIEHANVTVVLKNTSVRTNITTNVSFDIVPSSAMTVPNTSRVLTGLGVEVSLNFTNAVVSINYSNTSYSTEDDIRIYKCSDYNFTGRSCGGSWTIYNATLDKTNHVANVTVTSFSAYMAGEYEAPAPPAPSSSGGGSSGGGSSSVAAPAKKEEEKDKITITPPPYVLSVNKIEKKLKRGEHSTEILSISNNKAEPLNVKIDAVGKVKDIVRIDPGELILSASGVSTVELLFLIPIDADYGVYAGTINVVSAGTTQKIPVTIVVPTPEVKLLDVSVDVDTKNAAPGGYVDYIVKVFNVGLEEQFFVDLVTTVQHKETGEEVFREEETVELIISKSLVKVFDVPSDAKEGTYLITVVADYGRGEAKAIGTFRVEGNIPYVYFAVIPIFGIVGYVLWELYERKKKKEWEALKKKSRYIWPDMKNLPPRLHGLFLGKVADSRDKAYMSMEGMNMHTLIAGGTGSGKTVAGMAIVEEVRAKKVPVIVFDPTGQWTGFAKKNKDKKMFTNYKLFGLTRAKARSFSPTIIVVEDEKLPVDLKPYLKSGMTVFDLHKLTASKLDKFMLNMLEQLYRMEHGEANELKRLVVIDEVHRLLPKYGGKKAYTKLEQGVREFRKWGIGLLLISQVLTDFKSAVRGNISTEIQLRTKYEGDIKRVSSKYSTKFSRIISRMPIAVGMFQNPSFNSGNPYFVQVRPLLHDPHKLTEAQLKRAKKKPKLLTEIQQKKLEKAKRGKKMSKKEEMELIRQQQLREKELLEKEQSKKGSEKSKKQGEKEEKGKKEEKGEKETRLHIGSLRRLVKRGEKGKKEEKSGKKKKSEKKKEKKSEKKERAAGKKAKEAGKKIAGEITGRFSGLKSIVKRPEKRKKGEAKNGTKKKSNVNKKSERLSGLKNLVKRKKEKTKKKREKKKPQKKSSGKKKTSKKKGKKKGKGFGAKFGGLKKIGFGRSVTIGRKDFSGILTGGALR